MRLVCFLHLGCRVGTEGEEIRIDIGGMAYVDCGLLDILSISSLTASPTLFEARCPWLFCQLLLCLGHRCLPDVPTLPLSCHVSRCTPQSTPREFGRRVDNAIATDDGAAPRGDPLHGDGVPDDGGADQAARRTKEDNI